MFTGIITDIGKIKKISHGTITRAEIATKVDIGIGDSISVDGACLTVVEKSRETVVVEISQDTQKRTTLKRLSAGTKVNLELPLKAGDYLSGHIVSGHVDTTTRISKIRKSGDELYYSFKIPKGGGDYLIPMGSVAIDGISLTIKEIKANNFQITVIPQTIKATTLGDKRVGDLVNIEYDQFAKYLRHWTSKS